MNTQIKSVIPSAITSDKKEKTVSNLRNEIFRRYLRVVHILFAVLILIQFMPNQLSSDVYASYVIWFAVGVEVFTLVFSAFIKKAESLNLFVDIISFIYGLLIAWTLATAKFNILKAALFPPPGKVLWQFIGDYDKILTNIQSSVGIILQGYLLAISVAVPLGLFLGWSARLGGAATYISKFLGAIPPIVYIPYGIALLPTFRSVSVFVIFLATFWENHRFRKGTECRKIYNAVFGHSSVIITADIHRLQSGTYGFICSSDLCRNDRGTEWSWILYQKLQRFRRLYKNNSRTYCCRNCNSCNIFFIQQNTELPASLEAVTEV